MCVKGFMSYKQSEIQMSSHNYTESLYQSSSARGQECFVVFMKSHWKQFKSRCIAVCYQDGGI